MSKVVTPRIWIRWPKSLSALGHEAAQNHCKTHQLHIRSSKETWHASSRTNPFVTQDVGT